MDVGLSNNSVVVEDAGDRRGVATWKHHYSCTRDVQDGIPGSQHRVTVGELGSDHFFVDLRFDSAASGHEQLEALADRLKEEARQDPTGAKLDVAAYVTLSGNVITLRPFGQGGEKDFAEFLRQNDTLKDYIPPEAITQAATLADQYAKEQAQSRKSMRRP